MITLTLHQLLLLGLGAAFGGAIFGMIGFAYGILISIFIHHGFAAADVVFIVVGGAMVLNLGVLPRFWKELRWRAALPYILGAALGLPVGFYLLRQLDPRAIRAFVGLLVIAYGLFALRQQSRQPFRFTGTHGHAVDGSIGFTGGVIGGISGLGPLVPGVWFVVNILAASQEALSRRFSKLEADARFEGIGFTRGTHGVPVLDDVLAHLECRVETIHAGGDHDIVIGAVEHAATGEDRPLLYYRGGYAQLER